MPRRPKLPFLLMLISISVLYLLFSFSVTPQSSVRSITPTPIPDEKPYISVVPSAVPSSIVEQVLSASDSAETYLVVRVVDGDTVVVAMNGRNETLRLIGINTPETVDPRTTVQCFGREASAKAKEILSGSRVRLQADATQADRDRYRRLLRYIYLPDGTLFNEYMIEEGYAYEYTYSTPYRYQEEFKTAEITAQQAKKGLWSDATCKGNL